MNRTLYVGGEDFAIQTGFDPMASGIVVDFDDPPSALAFLQRFLADPHSLDMLRDLAADTAEALSGPTLDDDEVLELLARRLSNGSLRVVRLPATVLGARGELDEPATRPAPAPEAREEKTWVKIALVDDSDPPEPVPFKRYRIELPDGSVRQGMLDENGMAAFTGIDPGTCEVSFPDFDSDDWRRL